MEARKVIESFMYYMYNDFTRDESIAVFGENLGVHLWGKFNNRRDELHWFCELDGENRDKIAARAVQWAERKKYRVVGVDDEGTSATWCMKAFDKDDAERKFREKLAGYEVIEVEEQTI